LAAGLARRRDHAGGLLSATVSGPLAAAGKRPQWRGAARAHGLRVPATADTVGTKGKDYGGGPITEPIRQRFRIEYDVQLKLVTHALQLYNAEHGRYPATHEEFMKDIVEANAIRLPDLPPGQRYVYDPKTHTLMVERPKP
jgi:hypothetical protein